VALTDRLAPLVILDIIRPLKKNVKNALITASIALTKQRAPSVKIRITLMKLGYAKRALTVIAKPVMIQEHARLALTGITFPEVAVHRAMTVIAKSVMIQEHARLAIPGISVPKMAVKHVEIFAMHANLLANVATARMALIA
jgi:hypothetical protein